MVSNVLATCKSSGILAEYISTLQMTHSENEIVEGGPGVHLFIPVQQRWRFEFQVSKQNSGTQKVSAAYSGDALSFMGSQALQGVAGKEPGLCISALSTFCGQVLWEFWLTCLTNIIHSFVSPKALAWGNNPTPATEGQIKLKRPLTSPIFVAMISQSDS